MSDFRSRHIMCSSYGNRIKSHDPGCQHQEAQAGQAGQAEGGAMKERPILFSGPMVRAILAGTKTQTRRLAKFTPLDGVNLGFSGLSPGQYSTGALSSGAVLYSRGGGGVWNQRTKPLRYYALPGDRLWVRETWCSAARWYPAASYAYAADYGRGEERDHSHCTFERDGRRSFDCMACGFERWRPSIHMPRAASRITLEVTGVRVERLQAITEDDAMAEGVAPAPFCKAGRPHGQEHVEAFEELWDKINGARASWSSNPFVWVVEFRRVQP